MLSLKKGLVAACAAGALVFVPTAAFAGTSAGPGAQQQALVDQNQATLPGGPYFDCNGPVPGQGTTTRSLATMNLNGNGTLITVVHLQNAIPNVTYQVWAGPGAPCYASNFAGTITTNGQGNGNLTSQLANPPVSQGPSWVFMVYCLPDGSSCDYLMSPPFS